MKIALIENTGSDFFISRIRYALFLKSKGHQVIAIVPKDGYTAEINAAGIDTIEVELDMRMRSLKTMIQLSKALRGIFKKEKFDVIHFYRMQPNLIGTPSVFLSSRKSKVINHITGLGVAFTDTSFKHKIMQLVIKTGYRINGSLLKANLIFQNEEDRKEIGDRKNYFVIKGSAVNEDNFHSGVVPNVALWEGIRKEHKIEKGINLLFVSRLLKQKGLEYLIEAQQSFNKQQQTTKLNLLIAGWIDPQNPDSFTEKEIQKYSIQEGVAFLGRRSDIDQLISITDFSVLPTFYREGTPRFLLESMAMGKPIITTNMPGCNHLVEDNRNGILVNPKSVEELVNAFNQIIKQDLNILGKHSLHLYKNEFSEDVVYYQLLRNYRV